MALISTIVSIVVLGIIYKRMIGWEVPEPIGRAQSIVPVILGVAALVISFLITLASATLLLAVGYVRDEQPMVVQSVMGAFFGAGLSEEVAKGLMILITVAIFRSRIRNVYEYVLIGAAVGFGFTIFEEFLYGSGLAVILFRLVLITLHLLFSMIMAYYLGKARYQRQTGEGSATKSYILAFLIPIVLHTVCDACTGTNKALYVADDATVVIGMIISFAATIAMFIFQIVVLRRVRRDAEKLSKMEFTR